MNWTEVLQLVGTVSGWILFGVMLFSKHRMAKDHDKWKEERIRAHKEENERVHAEIENLSPQALVETVNSWREIAKSTDELLAKTKAQIGTLHEENARLREQNARFHWENAVLYEQLCRQAARASELPAKMSARSAMREGDDLMCEIDRLRKQIAAEVAMLDDSRRREREVAEMDEAAKKLEAEMVAKG